MEGTTNHPACSYGKRKGKKETRKMEIFFFLSFKNLKKQQKKNSSNFFTSDGEQKDNNNKVRCWEEAPNSSLWFSKAKKLKASV